MKRLAYLVWIFFLGCKIFQLAPQQQIDRHGAIGKTIRDNFAPRPEIFEISANETGNIRTMRGTAFTVPAGTFQGNGKVRIEIRETLSPLEGYALGLPMRSESGELLESDGMFRLDTDTPIKGRSAIRVAMRPQERKPMNVYAWLNGRWKYVSKNQFRPAGDEEATDSEGGERSFTGVDPNIWYNYDIPVPREEESCISVSVPQPAEYLQLSVFSAENRSFNVGYFQNTATARITFRRGVRVNVLLPGPDDSYWQQSGFTMPTTPGNENFPETCQKLAADLKPMPAAAVEKQKGDRLTLKIICQKYGRVARIETKSGKKYDGYFNQQDSDLTIQTTAGQMKIPISNVQKITPLDACPNPATILESIFSEKD